MNNSRVERAALAERSSGPARREQRWKRAPWAVSLILLGTAHLLPAETSSARHVPRSVVSRPAAGPRLLPSSHGDWTQWRGNPQHTGLQSLAGRIKSPALAWKYRLGGKLDPARAVLCSGLPGLRDGLLVSPPGRLAAYSLDGDPLWERRQALDLQVLGCWDFWGDGRHQVLAASNGYSRGKLYLFDAAKGDSVWESEAGPGQVGAVKVIAAPSSAARQLLWLPAASSTLSAFGFPADSPAPQIAWATVLRDFVSDPYSFSSLAIGTLGDGRQAIVIGGARHQIPSITLDARAGKEISRTYFTFDGHAVESGGPGQLLQLRDTDGSGQPQAINISGYGSDSSYMFQGITVNDPAQSDRKRVLDSYPVGMHYVRGSVGDFDGDGKVDILVSRFVPAATRHDMFLLNASTLEVKATLADFYLCAILPGAAGQGPQILGYRGVTTETLPGTATLVGYRYDTGAFRRTPFQPAVVRLATLVPRAFDEPAQDNPGPAAELLDVNGDGLGEILGLRDVDGDGKADELVVINATTGDRVDQYDAAAGVGIQLLAVHRDASVATSRIVLGADDGNLVFLDGELKPLKKVPVGGYYRSQAVNGHSFEVAVVANLEGAGNEIAVVDSRNRVLALTGLDGASLVRPPFEKVLWDEGVSQELVALPRAGGVSRLVVRGWENRKPALAAIDGSGALFWRHVFAGAGGNPAEDSLPIGMNYGIFRASASPDVILSMGASGVLPRRTCALDGGSGATLWCSDIGTFWDGTLAVWDFDGDGRDDAVMNFDSSKALVVSGADGGSLATAVEMPNYEDLEVVDYNGAPIVAGLDEQGAVEVVNAEDDAHLSMLTIRRPHGGASDCETHETWHQAQASPDDQRFSMAALAPMPPKDWIIGVGSQAGSIEARRGRDGLLLWKVNLWQGAIVTGGDAPRNSLSSVLAVDVDGDGRTEFLVGGFDGWLYALDAEKGALRWSVDLGAPLGDPIAADFDNDGFSELLVPAADGFLYAVGPAR